jgi:SAM-dependent methyltransferase
MRSTSDAAVRWAEALAAWALPPNLLDAAPRPPWGHDPELSAARALAVKDRSTPADRAARQALPRFGSLLDVACGAGAATVPLGRRGRDVTGVDVDPRMLARFATVVAAPSRRVHTVEGRWPDVEVRAADVVVCHDVLFDVSDLEPFVSALSSHARRRVVVVIPRQHPMSWLTPYFEQVHGLSRPSRPTAGDAVDVIRATGVEPTVEPFRDLTRWGDLGAGSAASEASAEPIPEDLVASVRRRLCLSADSDAAISQALERVPPPTRRDTVAIWWDTR